MVMIQGNRICIHQARERVGVPGAAQFPEEPGERFWTKDNPTRDARRDKQA